MTNKELIKEALQVLNPIKLGNTTMGTVACALITNNNLIFKGVCIDTCSGMGFCAEHTAISQMITQREYQIQKIVALKQSDNGLISIIPPCGR